MASIASTPSPVTMLWLAALPLFDILWSVTRRLLRRRSPLKPDHEHLHHLLLRAGFGVRGAFLVFVVLASALAAFGVAMQLLDISDTWSFGLLIVAGFLVVRLMYRAELLLPWLPQSLRRPAVAPPAHVAQVQQ
jgi:UDP-GlcNAc:undecaprenyl-phosphate/decaprenyl-phosphate GlcNAc-1-phosphate transferase